MGSMSDDVDDGAGDNEAVGLTSYDYCSCCRGYLFSLNATKGSGSVLRSWGCCFLLEYSRSKEVF